MQQLKQIERRRLQISGWIYFFLALAAMLFSIFCALPVVTYSSRHAEYESRTTIYEIFKVYELMRDEALASVSSEESLMMQEVQRSAIKRYNEQMAMIREEMKLAVGADFPRPIEPQYPIYRRIGLVVGLIATLVLFVIAVRIENKVLRLTSEMYGPIA